MRISKGSMYKEITEALKLTDNHCPCVPKYAWAVNTKCICEEFENDTPEGEECRCGRYKKEIEYD